MEYRRLMQGRNKHSSRHPPLPHHFCLIMLVRARHRSPPHASSPFSCFVVLRVNLLVPVTIFGPGVVARELFLCIIQHVALCSALDPSNFTPRASIVVVGYECLASRIEPMVSLRGDALRSADSGTVTMDAHSVKLTPPVEGLTPLRMPMAGRRAKSIQTIVPHSKVTLSVTLSVTPFRWCNGLHSHYTLALGVISESVMDECNARKRV